MGQGGQGGGTGTAFETGDGDMVSARLSHARRDCADANFRDQLHRDAGLGVDVLQVVD